MKTSILLWILLATASALCLYMMQLDINILLDQGLIQDDAFYYFEIARYLLSTGTPSFDGLHITNGFHPLWQAICLPVFYLWQGETPLRIMLGIASLFSVLSILLLFRILQQLTRHDGVAFCGAAVVALHGAYIRTWFNGLETALHIFTLLLFLQYYLQVAEKARLTLRNHFCLGVLAAIAFLARTDSAVIISVMFAFLYIPLLLKEGLQNKKLLQENLIGAFVAAAMILLISSPWLLWNEQQFGSIVQISGQMSGHAWLTGGTVAVEHPFYQDVIHTIGSSLKPFGNVVKKLFVPVSGPDWMGYLFILPLLAITLYVRKRQPLFNASFQRLWPFLLGVFVLFFYHAGVRNFVRSWYSTPLLLALVMLLCLLLHVVFTAQRRAGVIGVAVLVAVLLLFYSPYRYTHTPNQLKPDPRIAAALWLNQHTPADVRVGSANAGIVGYYTERPVINLDGVVNEGAFRARVQNQIHRYIDETGIDYLVDHKGSIAHLCADNAYFRCEELGRWDNATVVTRVIRSAQAPHIHSAKPPGHPAI